MKLSIVGFWGAYPEANGATSGYLLQNKNTNVLIDCGSSVVSKLQNIIALKDLDAVILSHYHADHMADIHCLQYATLIDMQLGKRKNPLPIYALVDETHFESLNFQECTEAIPIREESSVSIGSFHFNFIKTVHPDPCFAIRATENDNSVTYTADTGWFDDLIDFARYSDLLLCEASLYNENFGMIEGHLTAGEAGKLANMAEVENLILTHLPHFGDINRLIVEAKAEFNGRVEIASEFKTVEL